MHTSRFALTASGVAATAMLAACGSTVPLYGPSASGYPTTAPAPAPAPATAPAPAPASLEYGRVTSMEFFPSTATASPTYRVSIRTDQGTMRAYDVPAPGDLRVGDRVRVENGVIYRS
jgi:hypothetical protein